MTKLLENFVNPYRTERGFTVRLLTTEGPKDYPIVGCVQYGEQEVLAQWDTHGKYKRQVQGYKPFDKHALNLVRN